MIRVALRTSAALALRTSAALALAAVASSGPLATPSGAAPADPAGLVAAKRALAAAVNGGDGAAALEARARFAALAASHDRDPDLHAWVALAAWRALPLVQATDRKRAKQIGEDGLAHCDRALALDARHAPALALKGGLQGMMIGLDPGAMMTLGPASGENLGRARELAPRDPRVRLLEAIGTFHRPAMFGGGAKRALPELEDALALFAAEPAADSTAFDWGHDDAWTWKGRAHAELKQPAEAVAAYRRALERNPRNGWVRTVLLPAAEKAAGGAQAGR